MKILENQRECRLTSILASLPLGDGATWRMQRERSVIRLAIVVAGETESARRPENQHRRREPLRQGSPVPEVRRVKGGDELADFIVAIHDGAQRGVDDERAE